QPTFSIYVQKLSGPKMGNIEFKMNDMEYKIPMEEQKPVFIQYSLFRFNPYYWSRTSELITGDVISLNILDEFAEELVFKDVKEGIQISCPLNNTGDPDIKYVCKHWNTK